MNLNPYVSDDLMKLITKGARTLAYREQHPAYHPQFWQSRKLKDIITRHMHTMQEARVDVMSAREGVRWHAALKGLTHYGATEGSEVDFMTNAFTWINLPMQPGTEHTALKDALTAMGSSTTPARVIALCDASTSVPPTDKVRSHTLARIPTGAIRLTHTTTQTTITRSNTAPLLLIQIENVKAPQANYVKLAAELSGSRISRAIECTPPPWAIRNRVYHRHELPELTHRNPSHKNPTITWCRIDPTMTKGLPSRPTPTSTLLAAIGAGPQDLKKLLRQSGAPPEVVTPEAIQALKARARATAYQAYTRQARWTKADKYGPQGPQPDPVW
jgi:hypothetical protein